LSRVVNTESPSALRKRLLREIATVLQEGRHPDLSADQLLDVMAFILMALKKIHESLEQTTTAWEKRGYWLKADRFRLEWLWVGQTAQRIEQLLTDEDVENALPVLAALASAMKDVQPKKRGVKDVWRGAYDRWHKQA